MLEVQKTIMEIGSKESQRQIARGQKERLLDEIRFIKSLITHLETVLLK
jgi:hypothetical protein